MNCVRGRLSRIAVRSCGQRSVKCNGMIACRNVHSAENNGPLSFVERTKLFQDFKEKMGVNHDHVREGKFLVYSRSKTLISRDARICWMNFSDLDSDAGAVYDNSVLLGMSENGELQFSVQIANFEASLPLRLEKKANGRFSDFRFALLMLPGSESSLTSKAMALLNWHRKNKHCPSCGNHTAKNSSGSCRTCIECKEVWYPNLSPVGIVLVTDVNESKLLLVRQPRHPKGMYSCIAGYVDAGETLEDSIRREVAEEVGLNVEKVEYQASQHWAVPTSNLMIGCCAVVNGNEEIDMDKVELEDAKWFTREEVRTALEYVQKNPMLRVLNNEDGRMFVPPEGAVAHTLIKNWIQKHP